MAEAKRARRSITHYMRPKAAAMLALGFSSGLPFLLTGNTLGYWLRDQGMSLTVIGFLSYVGLFYSYQFVWAPFLDRTSAPLFGRLGLRRGWMLLAQALVALGLTTLSVVGVGIGVASIVAITAVVAFASASQDVAINAWRIESAENSDELGLLASAYQFGYRTAMLVTDALILIGADLFGWNISYFAMAALMLVGVSATLLVAEPARADAVMAAKEKAEPLDSVRGVFDAIAGPFIAFFRRFGSLALAMLLMIALYRLPDFVMGPMANPFLSRHRLHQGDGRRRACVGRSGCHAHRHRRGRPCCAAFRLHADVDPGRRHPGAQHCVVFHPCLFGRRSRHLLGGHGGGQFLDSDRGCRAGHLYVQPHQPRLYGDPIRAIFVHLRAPGKMLKGSSGAIVESLHGAGYPLMDSYAIFFIGAGAVGIPALILCIYFAYAHRGTAESVPDPAPRRPERGRIRLQAPVPSLKFGLVPPGRPRGAVSNRRASMVNVHHAQDALSRHPQWPVLAAGSTLEVRVAETPQEIEAAQRLRYHVFYEEMSAIPSPAMRESGRDFDKYDAFCDHLLVVDCEVRGDDGEAKVVGTYRLIRGDVAAAHGGFYTSGEYDLSTVFAAHPKDTRFLELGRSCLAQGVSPPNPSFFSSCGAGSCSMSRGTSWTSCSAAPHFPVPIQKH